MSIIDYILYILLIIGIIFNFLGSLGLLRFPDVYTRLHAGTKCTTFGSIFIALAIVIYGLWQYNNGENHMITLSIHTIIALIAIILTNPTGAHAIARAAHRSGTKPVKAVVDDLEEEKK
jgi:multicomponent Na+:H+ antiporter subunit G